MKIYWSARQIPELAGLSRPELEIVLQATLQPLMRSHATLAAILSAGLGVAGTIVCHYAKTPLWTTFLGAIVGGQAGYQIWLQWICERARPDLRQYLAVRGNEPQPASGLAEQ